jgi:hypothetical protein
MVVLMLDMDRKVGPWRLRVWGLALNFVGNVIALSGIVKLVQGGSPVLLIVGAALTVGCILALAIPGRAGVFVAWALAAAGTGGTGTTELQGQAAGGAVAFVDVHVLPMTTADVLMNQTVVVEDGRIRAIGPTGVVGTDISPWGFSLHGELQLLSEAGLTAYEVLRTATVNPAEFVGEAGEWGVVVAGARADLVLLAANPLESIEATREVEGGHAGRPLDPSRRAGRATRTLGALRGPPGSGESRQARPCSNHRHPTRRGRSSPSPGRPNLWGSRFPPRTGLRRPTPLRRLGIPGSVSWCHAEPPQEARPRVRDRCN